MCELSETSSPTPKTHLPVLARRPRCSLLSQVHYGYGGGTDYRHLSIGSSPPAGVMGLGEEQGRRSHGVRDERLVQAHMMAVKNCCYF